MQINQYQTTKPQGALNLQNSKVLQVMGITNEKINVQVINNLFSNYGNISKIVQVKNKGAALIEFENEIYAQDCKEILNNIKLMDCQLQIIFSSISEINISSFKEEDCFIGNEATWRFKKTRQLSINLPSNVIHISNLKKEAQNYQLIVENFGQFGPIQSIKFLVQENYKFMCLIRFQSIEEGINALASMHLQELCGRKMQISFTRSKI